MRDAVEAFQRELIFSRLELHGGSVKAARESLGLAKVTFYRLLKKLGIPPGSDGTED
jgi:DNA-binding NtrC family response regulator